MNAREVLGRPSVRPSGHLESIREIERHVQAFEQAPPVPDASLTNNGSLPLVPADFAEHTRLMIDLRVATLATDSIRVGSPMLGNDLSQRGYPEVAGGGHHEVFGSTGPLGQIDLTAAPPPAGP